MEDEEQHALAAVAAQVGCPENNQSTSYLSAMENSCVRLVPGALVSSACMTALKLAGFADPSWPVVGLPVACVIAWTGLLLAGATANLVLGRVTEVLENWRERLRSRTPKTSDSHNWSPLPPVPTTFKDSRHGRMPSTL